MKKIMLLILLLASLPSFAQMMPQWKHKFGLPTYSGAAPFGMVIDDSSNVYIFDDVVNYNNRTTCIDPVFRKLNKNGELLWYKNFGAFPCTEEHAYGLNKDNSGNIYLLYARSDSGTALTKINYNGEILWTKILGPNGNYIYQNITKLKISSTGVCYVNVHRYNRNLILKINSSGSLIDSIVVNEDSGRGRIDNFEISDANKIFATVLKDNNTFPWESIVYLIDSLHNILWSKTLNYYAQYPQIIFKNNTGIYFSCYYPSQNEYKINISKYDISGNILWNYIAPRGSFLSWNGWDIFPALKMDSDGNILFTGNILQLQNSFYFAKFNSQTGQILWDFKSGDLYNSESFLTNMAKDSSGNYYICGRIGFSNYQSGNSYAIFKLSSKGALLRTTLNNSYHYASYLPMHIGISNSNDVIVSGAVADTGTQGFYAQSLTIKYSQPVNITPNQNSLPDNFYLSQNYPNPFNPSTTINFKIPKSNFVSLKVFDINGRMVSELVNENLKAGEYKINFDGSVLPSGVYYYRLTCENFSESKKMILIK